MGRKAFRKSIKIAAGRAPPKSLGCAMMCDTASSPGVGRDRPPARQPAGAIHNRDEVLTAALLHPLVLSHLFHPLPPLLRRIDPTPLFYTLSIQPNFSAHANLRRLAYTGAHNIYIYVNIIVCIWRRRTQPRSSTPRSPPSHLSAGDTSPTAAGPKRTAFPVYTTLPLYQQPPPPLTPPTLKIVYI